MKENINTDCVGPVLGIILSNSKYCAEEELFFHIEKLGKDLMIMRCIWQKNRAPTSRGRKLGLKLETQDVVTSGY